MHKKMGRNKRGKSLLRTAATVRAPRVHSVKDLLAAGLPSLTHVTHRAARQDFWSGWLQAHLPAPLSARVSGVAQRGGRLVVFAESAAWSARLRFALLELESEIHAADPQVTDIASRVRPRA
jgi:hypothetical protein